MRRDVEEREEEVGWPGSAADTHGGLETNKHTAGHAAVSHSAALSVSLHCGAAGGHGACRQVTVRVVCACFASLPA